MSKKTKILGMVATIVAIGIVILSLNYKSIFKDVLDGTKNSEIEEDLNLYLPLDEELKGDSTENVGARDEEYTRSYNLEIMNLDILDDYIKSDKNVLAEIYAGTYAQVESILEWDTKATIDENSISYIDQIVKFTLLKFGNRKKIADVTVELYDELQEPKESNTFKIENLREIPVRVKLVGDQLIYVAETIEKQIKEEFPDTKSCYIGESTISTVAGTLYFDVFDSDTSKFLKEIRIEF
ncbi:hypothetical protein [Clostridium sp.]|uniref:hypothetical protein n=1 Tax=Clostridium sp. TaxID=1506 RepID=UPI001DC23ADD|nr:hypothetical protein [Clostridium sp.]MBS5938593.1 hypothetical protein [Clostridium sp.]